MNYYIMMILINLVIIVIGLLINKFYFKKGIKNFDNKLLTAVIIICVVIWQLPYQKMLGFKTVSKNFEYFYPYTFGKMYQKFEYKNEAYIFAYDESDSLKYYKRQNNKWYFVKNFKSELKHFGNYPVLIYSLPNKQVYGINISFTDSNEHNIKDNLSSKIYTDNINDPLSNSAVGSHNMILIKQKSIKNYVIEIDGVKYKPFE